MIEIKELCFGYSDDKMLLEKINISANTEEVIVLLGVNGSGKSTLLRCMNRFLKPSNGMILLDGVNMTDCSLNMISKKIAYVAQLIDIDCDICVRDYLVEGRTPHLDRFGVPKELDYNIVEEYAVRSGVERYLDSNMKHLSGGQKQLVAVTRALVQESEIIILDEPLSALDLQKQHDLLMIFKSLVKEGKTVIFSSHNPNHAFALNSKVWLLEDKCIHEGEAKQLLTEDKLKKLYGNSVRVFQLDNFTFCESLLN